jgi:hypothetical protein
MVKEYSKSSRFQKKFKCFLNSMAMVVEEGLVCKSKGTHTSLKALSRFFKALM